ncbi:hypothetical protein PHYSODRAFT_307610 [Phytophthora sojae]|uniref:Uncharacterized protein n=1 Tax=Phytophthora sojae (strain P6497) TaxID=1094619 RepID=G5AFD3_PHYSP|nr:hypothetical protein PHYSODRAFT_307610 [Phytophthora sojae]EGZ05923.1 hypothetical protein PHYSODRAFT_307610 [Phytophthora sojae]|eukprot:XP_009538784.1 hypothetical protein PHYSODRAFT_307610 [Phytophthora sojae]
MNWQQNVALQHPVGATERREERLYAAPNDSSGDSNILRYIKTLTSHQTNAKQQRMDRYLRQVKRPQPAEQSSTTGQKTLPAPGYKPQAAAKPLVSTAAPTPRLQEKNGPRESAKPPKREPKARNGRNSQGKAAGGRGKGRSRAKRQSDGAPSGRQRKKVKKKPICQQSTAVGSLDRFRLNGTWSQDKTRAAVTAKLGEIAGPRLDTVQSDESKQAPRIQASTCNADTSGSMKSRFWPSAATSGHASQVRNPGLCSQPIEANDSDVFCVRSRLLSVHSDPQSVKIYHTRVH